MSPIDSILRETLANDPSYKVCALSTVEGHICEGRITWEHAMYYAGKRIQARWAIIPLCAKYHEVDQFQDSGFMEKSRNKWCALNRATDEELARYERANFINERERLNRKYGAYIPPKISFKEKI